MKKVKKLLFLGLCSFLFLKVANAELYSINYSDDSSYVPDYGFVLGTHLYTSDSALATEDVINAALTVGNGKQILYEKYYDGYWVNVFGTSDDDFGITPDNVDGKICITHVDGAELEDTECAEN